ncbi:hypothetical protein Mapa_016756 [Marchantia paleacea]|nr:hypothetical protein Mapa_016756 [Marchantia paleacea]
MIVILGGWFVVSLYHTPDDALQVLSFLVYAEKTVVDLPRVVSIDLFLNLTPQLSTFLSFVSRG